MSLFPFAASGLAEVIEALASLAWPAILLVFLILFRAELTALMKRLTKFKGPGFEVELDEQLDKLDKATRKAAESTPSKDPVVDSKDEPDDGSDEDDTGDAGSAQPPLPPRPDGDSGSQEPRAPERNELEESEEAIPKEPPAAIRSRQRPGARSRGLERRISVLLAESAASPRSALIGLAIELERTSREILVSRGGVDDARRAGLRQQLSLLDLSPPIQEAAVEFQKVRNLIVHGRGATDADALRAIDLGIELLITLNSIPHEVNYVEAPYVTTFADAEGTIEHEFGAVVLKAVHPPAGPEEIRAYPVSHEDLPQGEAVTWEWNMHRVYPRAWYRNPVTDRLEEAWTSSAEFAGRPVHAPELRP